MQVHISKFNLPPDTDTLKHPGERALCGLRGEHGNAVCNLILFLGTTGPPDQQPSRVDYQCAYWIHRPEGFKNKELSIGESPCRMVRMPKAKVRYAELYEIMLCLNMEKNYADDVRDKFPPNIVQWLIRAMPRAAFPPGGFANFPVEPGVDYTTRQIGPTVSFMRSDEVAAASQKPEQAADASKEPEEVAPGYEFLPKLRGVVQASLPPRPPRPTRLAREGEGSQAPQAGPTTRSRTASKRS